jgi:protein-tyrosine phosphatase
MTRKIRVLFVCLGNICRSPLAEAIFKEKISQKGLDHVFEADSCGTSNYHIGGPPDPRTLANALKNGIRIDHCGRQLAEEDLENFDFVLAMDNSNLRNILRLSNAGQHSKKISLMRDFDPLAKGHEVPDPYFGGEQGFQEVYEILDRSIENFIHHVEANYLPKIKA